MTMNCACGHERADHADSGELGPCTKDYGSYCRFEVDSGVLCRCTDFIQQSTQSPEFDAGRTSTILEVLTLIDDDMQASDDNTVFVALHNLFAKVARLGYTEANK